MASRRSQPRKDKCGCGTSDSKEEEGLEGEIGGLVEELSHFRKKRQAKRSRPSDPVSEKPSDSPKIGKMGGQNENNLSQPKILVNANIKEVTTVTNQPSSSKSKDSTPVSKFVNMASRRATKTRGGEDNEGGNDVIEEEMNKWKKVAEMIGESLEFICSMGQQERNSLMQLLPTDNDGNDKDSTVDELLETDDEDDNKKGKRARFVPFSNSEKNDEVMTPQKAFHLQDQKSTVTPIRPGFSKYVATSPSSSYPAPVKKQQLSKDDKPLAIRPVDPEKHKSLDTSKILKIAKIGNQNGDEHKKIVNSMSPNKSPEPGTSSSKDQTETEDQELQKQIDLHENSKTNLRTEFIALIEKTNGKLFAKEEALASNDIRRDGLKKNLKEKQSNEKGDMDIKFHKEIDVLGQEMEEEEKKWLIAKKRFNDKKAENIKETEKILKRHRDETTAFDMEMTKEQDYDKNAVDKLKQKTNQLAIDLRNLLPDPTNENGAKEKENLEAARATLECPICMELMKPPSKIWMCSSSHIVCEPCRNKLKGKRCPTCRTEKVTLRAHIAENFARTLFNDINADRKIQEKKPGEKKALAKKKENVGNGGADGEKEGETPEAAAGGSKTQTGRIYEQLSLDWSDDSFEVAEWLDSD